MWLDHASFIIKLGDTTIITDPVLKKIMVPYGLALKICGLP